jgi:hypothetical protein
MSNSITHGKYGWFEKREPSYATLLRSEAVKVWSDTLTSKNSKEGSLNALRYLLDDNHLGVEEFLRLPEEDIKKAIKHTCLSLQAKSSSYARKVFYAVMRFLDFHDKAPRFKRDEKKAILRVIEYKRISKQYIPTKEDIYRMADSAPSLRDKAIILCLWQSGVRGGCLCNWTYGMFKNQLFKTNHKGEPIPPEYPLTVLVTGKMDSKISSYGLGYYYTFLAVESGEALKEYIEWRMRPKTVHYGKGEYRKDHRRDYDESIEQWIPKDEDPIFVTEGTVSRGKKLDTRHLHEILRNCAKKVGIDPNTVFPHVLRKAFRKTLYGANIPDDIAEAIMGHKLPSSRGNYFDYHDINFVKKQYILADWGRTTSSRIAKTESEVEALKERIKKYEEFTKKFLELSPDELITIANKMREDREKKLQKEIREVDKQDYEEKRTNNPQKVINEDEIEIYLKQGYRFVATLNGNKVIVEKF